MTFKLDKIIIIVDTRHWKQNYKAGNYININSIHIKDRKCMYWYPNKFGT